MSDVTGAVSRLTQGVTALAGRIDEDMQHQRDLNAEQAQIITDLRALVDQMATTEANDQAEISRLQAQADDLMAQAEVNNAAMADAAASIDGVTSQLSGMDPDRDFPAAAPPTDGEPPTDGGEPPADPNA